MSEPQRVELLFLGTRLTLRTEASPEYLQSLAATWKTGGRADGASGVRDDVTALMLAALDIADELFRAREDQSAGRGRRRAPGSARSSRCWNRPTPGAPRPDAPSALRGPAGAPRPRR